MPHQLLNSLFSGDVCVEPFDRTWFSLLLVQGQLVRSLPASSFLDSCRWLRPAAAVGCVSVSPAAGAVCLGILRDLSSG